MEEIDFEELTDTLEMMYPLEASYGTLDSLYGNALREKFITKETYDAAKKYYSKMWTYQQ